MYCSHLSALQGLLNDDQIQSLETYFSNLIGGAAKNITVSKLSRALNISPQVASRVLTKCKEIGIVNVFYTIRCPECGMLIKKWILLLIFHQSHLNVMDAMKKLK